MLRAGEYGKLGISLLAYVTLAAPVLVGIGFLVYYVARLLTYLVQRRWRVAAVLPVAVVWAAASYGMFLLHFVAGHAQRLDGWETFILAAILWSAIALYAGLGWAMHFLIRQ